MFLIKSFDLIKLNLDINITSNPDRWQTILIATGKNPI